MIHASSYTFIGIFILGLGLSLTPCVYPMLSITLSIFGAHKEESKRHVFLKALTYVSGIVVMYSSLGLIAAFTGSLFGAALQNQWVLFTIGVLIIGLSFGMFGVYEFKIPSWLIPQSVHQTKGGYFGFFISGLLVGIVAAPCVGPPIVALLTYVSTLQDPFQAFWIFFTLSLGLGFPYLILGTFTGLLHKLPQSGAWLLWVKHVFGFIMLALGTFYILLGVYPKGLIWVIPVGLFLGGAYLGWVEKAADYKKWFIWFKRGLGSLVMIAGVIIFLLVPKQTTEWTLFKPGMISSSVGGGQPVILDFYADWCIPCHELDHVTYANKDVIESLKSFIKIKIDLTKPDTSAVENLIDQYDVIGVPTVILFNERGEEKLRYTGYFGPEVLLEDMKEHDFL